MRNKSLPGAGADYFQVELDNRSFCGHSHQSVEGALCCFQESQGARSIVAIRKRADTIRTAKLYNQDWEYLTERQAQALIDSERQRGE